MLRTRSTRHWGSTRGSRSARPKAGRSRSSARGRRSRSCSRETTAAFGRLDFGDIVFIDVRPGQEGREEARLAGGRVREPAGGGGRCDEDVEDPRAGAGGGVGGSGDGGGWGGVGGHDQVEGEGRGAQAV